MPTETCNIDDILHKKSKMFSKMQKIMITNHCLPIECKNKVDIAMPLSETVAWAAYLAA